MKPPRRLRLIAVDGKLIGTPPPPPAPPAAVITSIDAALAAMRLAAAIVVAEPIDPVRGYSPDELAAQYAAVDRLVAAFYILDRLIGSKRSS